MLGRLISDNYWSFFDGYQIYKYVVYLLEEKDVFKYHLIDDNKNEIYKPGLNDIIYI